MPDLHVHLDAPLPDALATGAGTALFVAGWCTAGDRRVASLGFLVDGEEQFVPAQRMPRLDVLRASGEPASYRSGFWGFVSLRRVPATLALRARLDDGTVAEAVLARIGASPLPDPVEAPGRVAIAMATFNPPADLLRRQLDSIRAQTVQDWVCVISDDASEPERFAAIEDAVAGDPRFVVSRGERRLGFYRNFERALALVPATATHVAMADQDDAWHPDKLETLLERLGDAQLVYSDARIVDREGTVLADTYWSVRRNNHRDLSSLLVANAVTGAASLFRRDLLDLALPLPPAQFTHFHDHWVALCALALGDIAYVDRPLYDYVQHHGAVIGHGAANRPAGVRDRLATLKRDPRERIRLYRRVYFADGARLLQMATVLLLRARERMPAGKRQELERFVTAERSLREAARLWSRGARELVGPLETMGAQRGLAYAFAWRRLLGATAREAPQRGLRLDAVPPTTLMPPPGLHAQPGGAPGRLAESVAPLTLAVRADVPERVNVLVATADLEHLDRERRGTLALASRLVERDVRVRLVAVDPVRPLPAGWRDVAAGYDGLAGVFDRVEVAFGRDPGGLDVSPADRFVASSWRTAHIAHAACGDLGRDRFLYLVSDHEPGTLAMGSRQALAAHALRLPHAALFSSDVLAEHFRREGLGAGDGAPASFRDPIAAVTPASAEALAARAPRRLLLHAGADHDLYELAVLGLGRAVEAGVFRDGWLLRGVGVPGDDEHVTVGGGARLQALRTPWSPDLLRDHDIGLTLRHGPQVGLAPVELAAAGAVTVTTAFGAKTADALARISPNLVTAEPTVEGVAAALAEAVARVGDVERRIAASAVDWPRSWTDALDDALLDRVVALLGP